MNIVNKKLWYRALDRAVPETYNQLSPEQLGKAIDAYTELIIKECMATCSKQAADWEGEYADAHNDGVGSCISGIKEHFGVEE